MKFTKVDEYDYKLNSDGDILVIDDLLSSETIDLLTQLVTSSNKLYVDGVRYIVHNYQVMNSVKYSGYDKLILIVEPM